MEFIAPFGILYIVKAHTANDQLTIKEADAVGTLYVID